MLGNLFIRVKEAQDFETSSKYVFALLNVEIKETRYSENASGGRYVCGEALGLHIAFEEADSADFPDFDFLLSFCPQANWATIDRHSLDGFADILAKHLARHCMRISRPLEVGKKGTARVDYDDSEI